MITIALGLAAVAGGVAAGRWVYRRIRAMRTTDDETLPLSARAPVALGDVLVLDGGHGRSLWLARSLTLAEGEAAPFLVLFEADGPLATRAIVAFDPLRVDEIAVLSPQDLPGATLQGAAALRAPMSLEVEIDGAPVVLRNELRRTVVASFDRVPDAEGASDLPSPGEVAVATFAGGAHGRAVLVRDARGITRVYVGRTISLAAVSLLQSGFVVARP